MSDLKVELEAELRPLPDLKVRFRNNVKGEPIPIRPDDDEILTVDVGGGRIISETYRKVRGIIREIDKERLGKYRREGRTRLTRNTTRVFNPKVGKMSLPPKPKVKKTIRPVNKARYYVHYNEYSMGTSEALRAKNERAPKLPRIKPTSRNTTKAVASN